MSKVPVGASIAHAYGFLFGRFFQIVGTAWVPALLYGLGYFVFLTALQPSAQPPNLATLAVPALAAFAFFLVIRSVLGISLTQEALGVRKDLTLAHFVVGPREIRLFFGYLRYYLVFFLLYAAVLAFSFGALFLAKKYGAALLPKIEVGRTSAAVFAALALMAVLVIWFVLSMLRLVFLLPPVASAEHRTRLSRAWSLTRGSTLRILIVLIGTFLPAAIAIGVAAYYLIGPAEFAALGQAFQHMKPGNPPPLVGFLTRHAPLLSLIVGISAAINGALLAGASACAYRTVTGHEDPELEDDAALVAPLLEPAAEHDHHEEPADHGGHPDHSHGGHEDQGHGGHENHGHGHEEPSGGDDGEVTPEHDQGHGGHDDNGHGNGGHGSHDDHGHSHSGHEDHGHGSHDDHGGHDSHGHHAQTDHGEARHADQGHGDHVHVDRGRGHHGDDRAAA